MPRPSPALIRSTRLTRLTLSLAAATGLLLGAAGAASAHVRAIPDATGAGGFAKVTFRVPTESETARTTKLVVTLPTDAPFTSVRTLSQPGWTATVQQAKLPEPVDVGGATITEAARTVTWTAAPGTGPGPTEFGEFALSVGPLPAEGKQVVLPAVQTYSDGTTVDWDQPTPASGEEPEHPAPSFLVTAAEPEDGPVAAAPVSATTDDTDASDTIARLLGGGGLVVAVVTAAAVVARSRRSTVGR